MRKFRIEVNKINWPEVDKYLEENYGRKKVKEMTKETGIRHTILMQRIKALRLRWRKHHTPEEIAYLTKACEEGITYAQMCKDTGKTYRYIKSSITELGLVHSHVNACTPEKEQYIRDNYGELSLDQIAKNIDMARSYVRSKIYTLGIRRNLRPLITEEQEEIIRKEYAHTSNTVLEKRLGISRHRIRNFAIKIGLYKAKNGRPSKQTQPAKGIEAHKVIRSKVSKNESIAPEHIKQSGGNSWFTL